MSPELQLVIDCVQEKKADQVTVLDLRKLTSFTDHFVICTGESAPQLKTIFQNVRDKLSAKGISLHHQEGSVETGWILMDYDDFILHIFLPEKRAYYELERLWADAPRMDVSDPVEARTARASGMR